MNIHNSNSKGTAKYKELFDLYYNSLVGFASSYLKDEAEAEDVVQDVFCKIWQTRDLINYDANVKSLLFTSTKNRCITNLRSRICNKKFIDKEQTKIDNEAQLDILALEYSTIQNVELKELQEQIDIILNLLPEDMRQIFTMNRDKGMKYVEIANELNISVKTVEKKMTNTLKIFRKHLSDYEMMLLVLFVLK